MVVHFYFSTDLILSFYHSCFSLSVNLDDGVGADAGMIGVRGQLRSQSQVSIGNFIKLLIMTVRTCLYQILFLGQQLILLSVAQHDFSIKRVEHPPQLSLYSKH